MYKVSSVICKNKSEEIEHYIIKGNNTSEVLDKDGLYWMIQAGLIDNASARKDNDNIVIDVDIDKIPKVLPSSFQDKIEELYSAVREKKHNCLFELNMCECSARITGVIYIYHLSEVNIHTDVTNGSGGKYLTDIIGYQLKNTGTSLIYYETLNINTGDREICVLCPGETVELSSYETKLFMLNINVKCENAYLKLKTDESGIDLSNIDLGDLDNLELKTTHLIEKLIPFDKLNDTVLNRVLNTEEIWRQQEFLRSVQGISDMHNPTRLSSSYKLSNF